MDSDLDAILRKALEAEAEEVKRRTEVTPDEALKMAEALRKIRAGELDDRPERKVKLNPIEQAVEALKAGQAFKRELKQKQKLAKPKVHWSRKRAAKRKYDRTRYREILKPQRKAVLAERIQTAEGWWEVVRKSWERHPEIAVEMTEEEFCRVVYPAFYPHVPVFFRYDKSKGWRLDNLLIRDTETRRVLFDGMEYSLRQMGAVL